MEPFDVAVVFQVIIRRAAMHDAESAQRFQEARGSELRAVVRRQRQLGLAAALGQPCKHLNENGYFLAEIVDEHYVGAIFVELGEEHVASIGRDGHPVGEVVITLE